MLDDLEQKARRANQRRRADEHYAAPELDESAAERGDAELLRAAALRGRFGPGGRR